MLLNTSKNLFFLDRSLNLPTPGENRLPSIFRVKKVLKRKKGSERVKNSDRESENDALPPKSPHSSSKEKSKRKTKKNAVEVPKVSFFLISSNSKAKKNCPTKNLNSFFTPLQSFYFHSELSQMSRDYH